MTKKAKVKNDAIMTGILVTKYKMDQITVEDLEQMTEDLSKPERASAAKKVLVGIRGSIEFQESILQPEPISKLGQDGKPRDLT